MNNNNAIKVDNINININKSRKKKCNMETCNNNILEYYFNLPIKNKKAFIKIVTEDFAIPNVNEYNHLLTINYSVSQLKLIAKYYKLKTGGNKEYLKKHLYNYLFFSCSIINIQKVLRCYLIKKYIKLHALDFIIKGYVLMMWIFAH